MNSRERILGKLRAAAPASQPPAPDVAQHYGRTGDDGQHGERVNRFATALRAAHAEVHTTTARGWPGLLAWVLEAKGVRRLLCNPASDAGRQLAAALPASIEAVPFERPIEDWKEALFDDIDAGFSVADSAIAATGTLVFKTDARKPRTVSLVPPLHVALIDSASIEADLYTAATRGRWAAAMPTNLVLVSGPSKTSDIQQTLAFGAHGPRELLVLIVEADR
jgi:L-lactate dehydrogenase complex protein LldG